MIKQIPGFPDYFADTNGNIYDSDGIINDRRLFKQRDYYVIQLKIGNDYKLKKVHRLIALTFIPNPENKPTINHKDGNKSNNNVANLEWATACENVRHAINTGLINDNELKQRMTYASKFSHRNKKGSIHPDAWKAVALTDLNGNIVMKFKSTKDAISYVESKGWNPYCVTDCLRGHQKTVGPNRDMKFIRINR